jgi:nicotinamide mononucleotide transporter
MLINLFDYFGAILAFTSTILYARGNILAWPICTITCLITLYLYYMTGIFADAALELIYLSLAIYGVWHWLYGGANKQRLNISNVPILEAIFLFIFFITCYCTVTYILTNHTSSTVAKLDSLAMALSLVGQWLMCRKYIQTWFVWFIADAVLACLFYVKQLPAHLILNLIYLPITFYGYYTWSKLREQASNSNTKAPLTFNA